MKTAQEWREKWMEDDSPTLKKLLITVQADALRHAAEIAKAHRQTLFEDGLSADLHEIDDKVQIFCDAMEQERNCIWTALAAEATRLEKESR